MRVRTVECRGLALARSQVGHDVAAVHEAKHVGRLEVAMDHTRLVEALNPAGKPGERRRWPSGRRPLRAQLGVQGPRRQRHHEIGGIVIAARVQHREHVGMLRYPPRILASRTSRFLPEHASVAVLECEVQAVGQPPHLDDPTHPAAAEPASPPRSGRG